MIHYVTGDATYPIGTGPKVIAHIVNDVGAWGRGFVVALSKRWPEPQQCYREWSPPELGKVQVVQVGHQTWVANMCAQHGLPTRTQRQVVDLDALSDCLARLLNFVYYQRIPVHMPRIGTGLAGGRWDEIEPLIQRILCDSGIAVTVYDLPKKDEPQK